MKKINSLISVIVLIVMLVSPQGNVSAIGEIEAPQQSLSKLVWESKPDMPTAIYNMGAAVSGGKIYVIGGDNYTCTALSNVEEYDPVTEAWTTRASMLTGRWGVGVATGPDGQIYAFGGMGGGYCGADMLTTVEAYDPATDSWATRASMPTQRSGFGVAAATNGKIYIMGGGNSNGLLAKVEEYNPATDSWTQKADMPWPNNNIALAAASNGKIYVLGGDVTTEVLLEYDPEQDSWMQRASIPVARYGVKIAQASDGRIYAVGGGIGGGYTTSVEAYDPVSDTWLADSSINIARSGHILVAVGDQIFAMGGWGPAGGTDGGPLSSVEAGTITLIPPPANDNFSNATAFDALPFSDTVDTTSASLEPSESQYCGSSLRTVWYKFTPATDIEIRVNTEGSPFNDTNLSAYQDTGTGLEGLQAFTCTSWGNPLTFNAQAGVTYYFQVGYVHSIGELRLNFQEVPPPLNDNFANATVISSPLPFDETVDAAGATAEEGEPASSCAVAGYGGPYKSIWYAYTPTTSGMVSATVPMAVFAPVLAAFTGDALDNLTELGCQVFSGNSLTFPVKAGTTYYFQVSKYTTWDPDGSVQFQLRELNPPANDSFSNAAVIGTLPFSNMVDLTDATVEPYEPQYCNSSSKTVWYSFTTNTNVLVQVDMSGSSFWDTTFTVYQAYGSNITDLNYVQCASFENSARFTAQAGMTYYIQAGSVYGSGGSLQLNLQELIRPANDDFANTKVADPLPYSDSTDITNATTESGEPTGCYSASKTVWYSFTPTSKMLIQVDTSGSSFYDSFFNFYQANGPGFDGLVHMQCSAYGNPFMFMVQAGVTYYVQAGSMYGSNGILQVNIQELPKPANDDFANAKIIPGPLPFEETVNNQYATREPGEPVPSCVVSGSGERSVWYAFTPSTSGSISASLPWAAVWPVLAVYTGNSPSNLTQLGCQWMNPLTFQANTGTTYYFQISNNVDWEGGGEIHFRLEVTPPPVASFYYSPSDPSSYDTINFYNISSDPGNTGFQSFAWNFGDGTTSTDYSPLHKYGKDGDYTVQLSVTTVDGRTASATQVIQVRTRDVAITKLSAPQSASTGQTRTITVSVSSKAYPETVQIDLYRSVAGGFELIGTLTQVVPALSSNRTVAYNFNYTFTSSDASIGKVTFRAVATIVNGRDIYPADNEAYSLPTRVNKRK